MKINSKISIVIIVITIIVFIVIGANNYKDEPKISTIYGKISELDNLDIEFKYNDSKYFNNIDILNKGNIDKKVELEKPRYYNTKQIYSLIDVTSGEDDISSVGYEIYNNDDENYRNLIIDESKATGDTLIFNKEGSDERVSSYDLDSKNINRTKIKIEKSEYGLKYSSNILASNRYKDNLYLLANYENLDTKNYKNSLEILKVNPETKKIDIIDKIDIDSLIRGKYEDKSINKDENVPRIEGTSKYNNKIYVFISALEFITYNDSINRIFVLEYDIESNTYKLDELDKFNESNLKLKNSKLKENILEAVLVHEDEKIVTKIIKYDMDKKELLESYECTLEENLGIMTRINDIVISDKKIYLSTWATESAIDWDNRHMVYVIDKNDNRVSYKGKLIPNSSYTWIYLRER